MWERLPRLRVRLPTTLASRASDQCQQPLCLCWAGRSVEGRPSWSWVVGGSSTRRTPEKPPAVGHQVFRILAAPKPVANAARVNLFVPSQACVKMRCAQDCICICRQEPAMQAMDSQHHAKSRLSLSAPRKKGREKDES